MEEYLICCLLSGALLDNHGTIVVTYLAASLWERSAVDESTAERNACVVVSLGHARRIHKRWGESGPAKQDVLSHTVVLAGTAALARPRHALHVLFPWARALNKPPWLHRERGAAFHAGGLWLLQRMLHSGALAGGKQQRVKLPAHKSPGWSLFSRVDVEFEQE